MYFNKNVKIINPASGAIIMACGIFLYSTIEAFPFLALTLGDLLACLLMGMGVFIYYRIIRQLFQEHFLTQLIKNPVNSFTMGTWVAGLSVLANVGIKYYPALTPVFQVIAVLNTIFYLFFLFVCVYNFKELFKRPSAHSTHGVVLLSTVATQSIVIMLGNMFPFLSDTIIRVLIGLGLLFYICGAAVIAIRYFSEKQWTLTEDWTNTNCILHGALSITGLALVLSKSLSATAIMFFWLFVFTMLIAVELIEVDRAIKRVRKYGWKEGLFTYNISQWSRNFTFGMFYAFSFTMHENPFYMNAMYGFHEIFLAMWAWIVLSALVVEICLWAKSKQVIEKMKKEKAI